MIDVGAATGCLVPHLQQRGVRDILAVDLAAPMLDELQQRYGTKSTCGNDLGVRTWCGDFLALPVYMGTADCIVVNAVLGNFLDRREVLLKAVSLLRPGGYVVLSHPLGRKWHTELQASQQVNMVPSLLPSEAELEEMVRDLPLALRSVVDEPELYLAVLQVPLFYHFDGVPLTLEGPVVTGFGRGSRQLGIPTANLDPAPLQDILATLPKGVYFGWAQLQAPEGWPEEDGRVHKMVMNIGRRPTVEAGQEGGDLTVEAHVLHKYSRDFYGCRMRCVALGYLRPETKFPSITQLVQRIRTDIGLAASTLQAPHLDAIARDPSYFQL